MDIRKADAKGRVTGFPPGAYYEIHETPIGYVLRPVAAGGYVSGTGPLVGSSGCVIPGTAQEGSFS